MANCSMLLVRLWCLLLACTVTRLAAQSFTVPGSETARPPTAERLKALAIAADRDGWSPQIGPLREAALRSYDRGNLATADAWFAVYAWAVLWSETGDEFTSRWISAVNAAKVGHSNMRIPPSGGKAPHGAALSAALRTWLLNDRAFSQEFFSLISPVDHLPRVFEILDKLHQTSPTQFQAYSGLALAIAVVFDVPPPPYWPHAQVGTDALPRKFPDPVEAFGWWVMQDQQGRIPAGLKKRSAAELKFVVDASAPFAELEWAQAHVARAEDDLATSYAMVPYDIPRASGREPNWPAPSYELAAILALGGICADQAYFATQVGKARGVPTLLFHGAGNDGRHAWLGFLDRDQRWQLDTGRYAEQRYVTGFARDPQTWKEFSDHELQFLKEHFRTLTSYRQSRAHAQFAMDFLRNGDADRAAVSARQAVRFEPRNQDGWETLIDAERRRQAQPKAIESILREAVLAFQRCPDLEAFYVGRLAQSLRARGQLSEADAEIQRVARKNQGSRVDITVQQAREIVLRSIRSQPLQEQVRAYNQVVDTFGPGAGIGFFDEVVRVFVEHLLQLRNRAEAARAIERARRYLKSESGSQLDQELSRLERAVERMPRGT